jgi:CSLREA domain-containing protein
MRARALLLLFALGLTMALTAAPVAAASLTVNSLADTAADDGFCTLREAITAANTDAASGATLGECVAGSGTDTVSFSVSGTITLTSALPAITSDLSISGAGTITQRGRRLPVFNIVSGRSRCRAQIPQRFTAAASAAASPMLAVGGDQLDGQQQLASVRRRLSNDDPDLTTRQSAATRPSSAAGSSTAATANHQPRSAQLSPGLRQKHGPESTGLHADRHHSTLREAAGRRWWLVRIVHPYHHRFDQREYGRRSGGVFGATAHPAYARRQRQRGGRRRWQR